MSPLKCLCAALQAISLKPPFKPTKKPTPIIDDACCSLSPDSEVEKIRMRSRIPINISLAMLISQRVCRLDSNSTYWLPACRSLWEPLLMESKHRFFLFPIQYHEVSPPCIHLL